jgi:hypothetical protein
MVLQYVFIIGSDGESQSCVYTSSLPSILATYLGVCHLMLGKTDV